MKIQYVIEAAAIGLLIAFVGWVGGLEFERGPWQAYLLSNVLVIAGGWVAIRCVR